MFLLPALTLGLAGSLHCAGMCGPLALALPLKNGNVQSRLLGAFLYNIGRAVTYAFIGLLFGFIGQGFEMAGFQQWVSISMGSLMIFSVLIPTIFANRLDFSAKFPRFFNTLKHSIGKQFKNNSVFSLFTIGLLNGLLPCGLVYIAVAGAIATTNALQGALFMFVFGLGTLPMLFTITIAGSKLNLKLRQRFSKLIPVIIVTIGIVFILRGMAIGIPYISPNKSKLHTPVKVEKTMQPEEKTTESCCH